MLTSDDTLQLRLIIENCVERELRYGTSPGGQSYPGWATDNAPSIARRVCDDIMSGVRQADLTEW